MATVATESSFVRALRIQGRVLGALMMWEVITRYGRDNLGFIWLFLEPMIFTLCVTALWFATGLVHLSALPIVAFALTGYSSVLLWRNCASRCSMAIPSSTGLLFHRPVRALDLLMTRIFLEIGGASMSFLVLGVLWISVGLAQPPSDILKVLGGWAMLAWFGAALALNIGALTSFTEITERLWHPTAYILFPLSGAVFMVDWLAEGYRDIILWLPMVHCIELIRDGFFGSVVRTHYDIRYVAVVCMVMTAIGLVLVRAAGRRVKFR